jgi:hypothetical protein
VDVVLPAGRDVGRRDGDGRTVVDLDGVEERVAGRLSPGPARPGRDAARAVPELGLDDLADRDAVVAVVEAICIPLKYVGNIASCLARVVRMPLLPDSMSKIPGVYSTGPASIRVNGKVTWWRGLLSPKLSYSWPLTPSLVITLGNRRRSPVGLTGSWMSSICRFAAASR